MNKLLIYGSRDFARLVKDIARQLDYEFVGYIDDFYTGGDIVGTYEEVKKNYLPESVYIVIAVGYNDLQARWNIYQKVTADKYTVPSLIHPAAYVRNTENIGRGAIVMARSVIDQNARLDELTVAWPGVVVNHDSCIRYGTFLSPGVIVCGFVNVGPLSFIGANAVVVDHVDIPGESFVKAGTVYTTKTIPQKIRKKQ